VRNEDATGYLGGDDAVVQNIDPIFVTLAPGRGNEVPRAPGREMLGGTAETEIGRNYAPDLDAGVAGAAETWASGYVNSFQSWSCLCFGRARLRLRPRRHGDSG
jgi:hypothetical protein